MLHGAPSALLFRCVQKILSLLIFFGLLATATGYAENYDPVAVYLTWQRSPESTITIRWISQPDRQDDLIEYQREADGAWRTATGTHSAMPENIPYLIHSVELTNLFPNTNYLFRTGPDAKSYKFKTMPAILESPISFVAGGDMYHDGIDILHKTNRQAAKTAPLFALVGGDIAYAADRKASIFPQWAQTWINKFVEQKAERWLEWLIAWKEDMVTPDGRLIPLLPVIGNHDVTGYFGQTPAQAPFFYSLFAMPGPQGYNVLDFGNYMSIVLLDSGHTHPVMGQQAQWLTHILAERKDIPHKFALYHVPAYPSVRSFQNKICAQIRQAWVPAFEQSHLTAAFENHDHAYKRTFPLLNGRSVPKGVVYVGDGAWGVAKPRKPKLSAKRGYLAYAAAKQHFIHVTVEPDKRSIKAISSNGELIDEYSW